MLRPAIYADFQNADPGGRIRLNCVGTMEDLSRQQIALREGLVLTLYSDDADDAGRPDALLAEGVVGFSHEEHCWVATISWDAIRHASDEGKVTAEQDGATALEQLRAQAPASTFRSAGPYPARDELHERD